YAFDTPEELDAHRERAKEAGNHNFKYDAAIRLQMRNSLSLPTEEVQALLDKGTPYAVRLKVPENQEVVVRDLIRGDVHFQTRELDDKVLLKADGMPTYHLANIV
ncbi:glutamate--tRNA ligase family protein, partial [Arthrospira platensis SPKY1]|nr:glutamate--tRNA ligase family protein [Arthrospira platensis SPKY1]